MEGVDFDSPTPLQIIFNIDSSPGPVDPVCATIDILDDTVLEGNHEFSVQITGVGPAAEIGSPDTTTVVIDDDEREHS